MRVALVSVGDEVLCGDVVDTNSAEIGRALTALGCQIVLRLSVGDKEEAIASALERAVKEADFVVVVGGLGPTEDDRTREAVARWLGKPLVKLPEIEAKIEEFFRKRGRSVPPTVAKQAQVPQGAQALENPLGTAPGIRVEREGKVIFCLPGVPSEMRMMLESYVLPEAKKLTGERRLPSAIFKFCSIGESDIAQKLTEALKPFPLVSPAFYPMEGEVKVVLKSSEASDEGRRQLEGAVEATREALGEFIYAEEDIPLEKAVGQLLREAGKTLAVAESCTGGLVGHRITQIPGSSDYFWGGVVAYDNEAKVKLLGVSEETLKRYGAVSEQCAREMARGIRRASGADIGVSITGIAGPTGGTPEKPVGLVHFAVSTEEGEWHARRVFPGDRHGVKRRASTTALDLVRRILKGLPIR